MNNSRVISRANCGRIAASPRDAGHVAEGSDPQIAYTIGGLAVSLPTHPEDVPPFFDGLPCRPWRGRPSEYQIEAKWVIEDRLDRSLPWWYAVPRCGTKMCLTDMHLNVHRAQKIAYPAGVCTYCGMPGFTKDHLLPVTVTGKAVRKFVAVVPACGECNSAIGDRVGHRITERREEAHERLRKKNRRLLESPIWSEQRLVELGPNLGTHIRQSMDRRQILISRLSWPSDPDYDRRAFEKSGIDDPIAMDLL